MFITCVYCVEMNSYRESIYGLVLGVFVFLVLQAVPCDEVYFVSGICCFPKEMSNIKNSGLSVGKQDEKRSK